MDYLITFVAGLVIGLLLILKFADIPDDSSPCGRRADRSDDPRNEGADLDRGA